MLHLSLLFLLLNIVLIIFLISHVEVNFLGVEELPPANQKAETPSLVVNKETAVNLMGDPRLLAKQMMTVVVNQRIKLQKVVVNPWMLLRRYPASQRTMSHRHLRVANPRRMIAAPQELQPSPSKTLKRLGSQIKAHQRLAPLLPRVNPL